jgi:hypothetical protein
MFPAVHVVHSHNQTIKNTIHFYINDHPIFDWYLAQLFQRFSAISNSNSGRLFLLITSFIPIEKYTCWLVAHDSVLDFVCARTRSIE